MNFAKFLITPFFTEHLRWLLLLLNEIQNTKKMKTRESKERIFEKKVRGIGWVVLIFIYYIVVFAFLSSTVEVGRWQKLNEMFVFGMLFICYIYEKFSRITSGWQLFAYFYQISNKCCCLIFLIDLFSLTNISSGSQKYKVRTNLEVP